MAPITAAVVAVFCPSRAAAGTRGVSLWRLLWAHVFGAALGAIAVLFVVATGDTEALALEDVFYVVGDVAVGIVGGFIRYPGESFLTLLAIVVGIEVVSAVVAFVFMSAGARDEPLRSSYVHSLRQVWLSTTRIAVVILFAAGITVMFRQMERAWEAVYPKPVSHATVIMAPRAGDYADQEVFNEAKAAYDAEWQQFQAAMRAYGSEVRAWRRAKPWYLREFEVFLILAAFVGMLWYVLLLLRGIAAPRTLAPVDRPPLCEYCGYNLTAATPESRCPECGIAVAESLSSDVRPGAPWEQRVDIGWFRAFADTAWCAMRRASELGRDLRVGFAGRDHRRFAALHYPVIFLVGVGAMMITALTQVDVDDLARELHLFCVMSLIFGTSCVLGAIVFSHFGALFVGSSQSLGTRRNLIPVANQASCYLFSFLVLWEVFGAFMAFFVITLGSSGCFRWLESATGSADGFWMFITWVIPNALWGIAFLVFVSQATVAARYANK